MCVVALVRQAVLFRAGMTQPGFGVVVLSILAGHVCSVQAKAAKTTRVGKQEERSDDAIDDVEAGSGANTQVSDRCR